MTRKEEILMSQTRYYSPKIRRDLVSKLYWNAQSLSIPMTKLVDLIVAEGLVQYRIRSSRKQDSEGNAEQLTFDF